METVRVKCRLGPDGVHFLDRRSGLNLLIDDIQVPKELWHRAPRQMSIALTNACDLHCPYCYAPKAAAVLDANRLGVGFGGGEPTLYRRLPELCRQITARTALAVTMTTHGHRWTPQLANALTGNVHFVRVSVDGVGATYETLRNRSFSELVNRLTLISHSFPFGINCVVNTATFPDLDAVADLAETLGAAELLLLPERPARGRPGVDSTLMRWLHEWIAAYHGPVPLAISEGDAGLLATAVPLPREIGLRAYAHIDASGMLKRTSYDGVGETIDDRGALAAVVRLQREVA
jgi:pyruvate-formate lyase-activating enzyme